jgi:hypothetical protein
MVGPFGGIATMRRAPFAASAVRSVAARSANLAICALI